MTVLRTPEERFKDLPGFPFTPHYVEINGLRIHYLDEGQGEIILCLHGVPTWSYLYRKMIPFLTPHCRVIAPDFIGFGRSDKFRDLHQHSLQVHRNIFSDFIDALTLGRVTLVGHDFGAVVGLCLATKRPELFERLVIMNCILPTGDRPLNITLTLWKQFLELAQDMPVGRVIRMGLAHGSNISKAEVAAYEAPFPDVSYKAGPLAIPLRLPMRLDDPDAEEIRVTQDMLSQWAKPALVMFSDEDPLFSKEYRFFRTLIPTAKDQPEIIIPYTGHFLQEERGPEIAKNILDFIDRTPVSPTLNNH